MEMLKVRNCRQDFPETQDRVSRNKILPFLAQIMKQMSNFGLFFYLNGLKQVHKTELQFFCRQLQKICLVVKFRSWNFQEFCALDTRMTGKMAIIRVSSKWIKSKYLKILSKARKYILEWMNDRNYFFIFSL